MTVALHLTPRCRRPPGGQVSLNALWLHTGQACFIVPTSTTRLVPATTPHVVQAVSAQSTSLASALRFILPVWPDELLTTAVWIVSLPHNQPVTVTHAVRWILPPGPASVLSDDTWLWHLSPSPPRISPGDWPVMEVQVSEQRRRHRRSLTVIDTRNRAGLITRRFQSFPLAPLPDDSVFPGVPETPFFPCKEDLLCTFSPDVSPLAF